MRKEIMIAGSGGQGVITASILLAEAAAIHEGLFVVQSQAYGPEARGGSSSAHVIIDDQPIGYPKVTSPNTMACLTQEAFDKFSGKLRPGGLMLTDRYHVRRIRQLDARMYNLALFAAVKDRIALPVTFNVCVLGALVGLTSVVRPESLRLVLERRIAPRFLARNLEAFDLGLELAGGARTWRVDTNTFDSHGPNGYDAESAGPRGVAGHTC